MKLLKKAIVSLLLIGYCVLLYIFGKLVATAGISVFIFGCLYEFYSLCEKLQLKPLKVLGLSVTCCLICEAYINNVEGMLHILLIAVFLTFLLLVLDKNHGHHAFLDASVTIFGLVYIVFPMCHLILLCAHPFPGKPTGLDFFMFIIFCNSVCDMCANGIGSWFGKTKMLSHVSPSKTVEGTVGGMIMAVLISIPAGYLIKFPLSHSLLAGLIIAISGVVGDFSESLIKRCAGVKDTANVFIEHGGMMDRCDSLFMSSFFFYLYLHYFFWVR